MEQPRRKRGRPRVPVTEELIEARRLSKQRRNRQQRGGNDLAGPSRSAAEQLPVMPVTRLGSALETPRQRAYIDQKKGEFGKCFASSIYFKQVWKNSPFALHNTYRQK